MVANNPMFTQMSQQNPALGFMTQNPELMVRTILVICWYLASNYAGSTSCFWHTTVTIQATVCSHICLHDNRPNSQPLMAQRPVAPSYRPAAGGANPWFAQPQAPMSESQEQLRVRFARQLEQLHEMGFLQDDINIEALRQCLGDVPRAVERLLM